MKLLILSFSLVFASCSVDQRISNLGSKIEKPLYVIAKAKLKPASKSAFVDKVRALIPPTLKEVGNNFYYPHVAMKESEVIFYESWKSDDALNEHFTASHTKKFVEATKSYMAASPELDKYHLASTPDLRRAKATKNTKLLYGIGTLKVKKTGISVFKKNLEDYVIKTRKEKGNRIYEILQSKSEPGKFVAYEVFDGHQALKKHFDHIHTKEFVKKIQPFLVAKPVLTVTKIIPAK